MNRISKSRNSKSRNSKSRNSKKSNSKKSNSKKSNSKKSNSKKNNSKKSNSKKNNSKKNNSKKSNSKIGGRCCKIEPTLYLPAQDENDIKYEYKNDDSEFRLYKVYFTDLNNYVAILMATRMSQCNTIKNNSADAKKINDTVDDFNTERKRISDVVKNMTNKSQLSLIQNSCSELKGLCERTVSDSGDMFNNCYNTIPNTGRIEFESMVKRLINIVDYVDIIRRLLTKAEFILNKTHSNDKNIKHIKNKIKENFSVVSSGTLIKMSNDIINLNSKYDFILEDNLNKENAKDGKVFDEDIDYIITFVNTFDQLYQQSSRSTIFVPYEWREYNGLVLSACIMIIVVKEDGARYVYLAVQSGSNQLSIPGGFIVCRNSSCNVLHALKDCVIKENYKTYIDHMPEIPCQTAKREFFAETDIDEKGFNTLNRLKREITYSIPSDSNGQLWCYMYLWIIPESKDVLTILDGRMTPGNGKSVGVGLFDLAEVVDSIKKQTDFSFTLGGKTHSSRVRNSQVQNFTNLSLRCINCGSNNSFASSKCNKCNARI